MKKLLALVLALSMVMGIAAVASADGSALVSWYTFGDVYLTSVRTALDAAFADKGIAVTDKDSNAIQTTQTEDINTITCKAVLYCSKDLDEETVYQITKAFYESGDEIAAAHATGKEVKLEGCLDGVTTPIHPGAARYYKEKGITVPNN